MPVHQLAAILESINEAVIITDLDNVIKTWNRAAERIYGYSTEEVVGLPFSMLLPRERAGMASEVALKIASDDFLSDFEAIHVTRDGRQTDVIVSVSPIHESDGKIRSVLRVVRTAELQKAERALQQANLDPRNRALVMETAGRVALDILSSRTGVEALRHIADAARVLAGARYAALGVARRDGLELEEFITVGLTPAEEMAIGPRPRGAGVLGVLLRRTRPLRIGNLSSHPASVGFPANHPPMKSFLGVPIRRGDNAMGSLYLTNKIDGDEFTEADEAAVQALGSHAAVAIHNLHMLSQQRSLVRGLFSAQEEERRAVAYDLHDGLTQFVMAAHAHFEAFRRARDMGRVERTEHELDQGLRYLKEAVVESRRLVNGLRSLALDDLGLGGAVELLVNEEKERAGWTDVNLTSNVSDERFEKNLETGAYRVVQEALTNARKYAHTKRVAVSIVKDLNWETGAPQLTLEVRDWGQGFKPQEKIGEMGHVGLQGMQERVTVLGGQLQILSAPGEGTTIRAVFQLVEQSPGDSDEDVIPGSSGV
ncbi:MAG TPA: PAS domain S-box protein [Armatimonadota bacterium]|nr:PAS domain S-box protein [Armatimonadota bacterium]